MASLRPSPRADGRADRGEHRSAQERPGELRVALEAAGREHDRVGGGERSHALPGLDLNARVQAGLEQAGEQGPSERERPALLAPGELLPVDLPGRELDVRDRSRHVRGVTHHRGDVGRRVDRQRLERPATLFAASLELGVVVGVGNGLPGHRGVALQPLGDRPRFPCEHLQHVVVRVAEGQGAEVGEPGLGGVVRDVPIGGEPAVAAGERRRAPDPIAALHHRDGGSGLRRGEGRAEPRRTGSDDRDAPHIDVSPPSGVITWPVMKLASSESRKQTGSAISRGSPIRPSGIPGIACAAPFS